VCYDVLCDTDFPTITTVEECEYAAEVLGLEDTRVNITNNASYPTGCYWKRCVQWCLCLCHILRCSAHSNGDEQLCLRGHVVVG